MYRLYRIIYLNMLSHTFLTWMKEYSTFTDTNDQAWGADLPTCTHFVYHPRNCKSKYTDTKCQLKLRKKKINQYKPIPYIYLNYIPQIGQDATTLCLWFCNPPRPEIVLSLTQHPLILLLYYPPRRNALLRYNGKWESNNQAHKCYRNVSI